MPNILEKQGEERFIGEIPKGTAGRGWDFSTLYDNSRLFATGPAPGSQLELAPGNQKTLPRVPSLDQQSMHSNCCPTEKLLACASPRGNAHVPPLWFDHRRPTGSRRQAVGQTPLSPPLPALHFSFLSPTLNSTRRLHRTQGPISLVVLLAQVRTCPTCICLLFICFL